MLLWVRALASNVGIDLPMSVVGAAAEVVLTELPDDFGGPLLIIVRSWPPLSLLDCAFDSESLSR